MKKFFVIINILVLLCSIANAGEVHIDAMHGYAERVKELIEKNPSLVNQYDDKGMTPLHYAAERGSMDTVKILVKHGADVNVHGKDKYGYTPLHRAATCDRKDSQIYDVITFLVKKGADIEAKNINGLTPLHLSIFLSFGYTTECLIKNGANVNVKEKKGNWTPLHFATDTKLIDTAKLLLKHGAASSLKVKDYKGRTPLDLARLRGCQEMVELLQSYGAKE